MGMLTLKVCQTVPNGVLLFLPSYRLMENLVNRWQNTGLYNDLESKKVVITEPKYADEFEAAYRHFYETIETTTKYPSVRIISFVHSVFYYFHFFWTCFNYI